MKSLESIHHNIRNPLQIISAKNDVKYKDEVIRNAVNRITEFLNKLPYKEETVMFYCTDEKIYFSEFLLKVSMTDRVMNEMSSVVPGFPYDKNKMSNVSAAVEGAVDGLLDRMKLSQENGMVNFTKEQMRIELKLAFEAIGSKLV